LLSQDGTFAGTHVTGRAVTLGCYKVLFDMARSAEYINLRLKFSRTGLALFRGI
jgi:hypothetical protein